MSFPLRYHIKSH